MDIYYDVLYRDFVEIDEVFWFCWELCYEGGEFVDEEIVVIYKGLFVDELLKICWEYEIGVEDGEMMNVICEVVGFEFVVIVEKECEWFVFDGYIVLFDLVFGFGEFVEVEIEVEFGVDDVCDGVFVVF